MFGFANFLLLALFAAAAVDLIGAWRRCGRPVPALRVLWREEHLLFGGWGAARRLQWGPRLFCLGLALYEFTVVFCNSMAREQWPWVQARLAPVLDVVMYLAFFGKILLGTRYSWRSLGLAGALYFIARWVYFNGQNIWFLGLAVVLLAAKDVPLRRSMRAFLASGPARIGTGGGAAFCRADRPPALPASATAVSGCCSATATPTPSAASCWGWCWPGCCCAWAACAGWNWPP